MARKLTRPKLSPEEAYRRSEEIVRALELQADMEDAENSLKFFLQLAWPTVNPGTQFQDNWHLDCLTEHLTALYRREIRKLIINISPRSLKSKLISVIYPAWVWLKKPEEKFLCASFGRQLALRDSRYCRNLIASKWYQARWGSRYSLASDQNEKGRFENDKGGFRIIASVEGGVLGEGGSCRIYDDPNDLAKMVSEPETYPQSVREWYSGTAASRSIDPKSDVQLCVQQRASYGGDLTEYLMELGGWEQLVIPNEYDGRKTLGPLAIPDPRTHLGELMFPSRLGPEETATLKREQRQHYEGQYNQNPSHTAKSGLRKEWWNFWNPPGTERVGPDGKPIPIRIALQDGTFVEKVPVTLPDAFEQVVTSLDCAFKDLKDSDFVANHAWGRVGANTFLLGREHDQMSFSETLAMVRRFSQRFPCPEKLVEDKANGPAVIDTLKNEIPGLIPVNPAGGKWSRVAAISGYVEAGNVYLPNPDLFPWVWDLISEFAAGIRAVHDDDTDAMSQALKRLYDASARAGVPEFRVAPRVGEPQTAAHVSRETIRPEWRKFAVAVPGQAALWIVETPTGSLRVIRELDISKLDAVGAGREIGRRILQDLKTRGNVRPISGRSGYEILLPKIAFAPLEPVGCWAEMMEQSLLAFEPEDGDWDARNASRGIFQAARIRTDMVEEEEGSIDRLRSLLAFAPPDFRELSYEREKALSLADQDLHEYHRYLGMCAGKVVGEWPKLKIFPECTALISELGAFRKDLDPTPFVQTLLLGVCAPRTLKDDQPRVVESEWSPRKHAKVLMGRKFSMGRLPLR